MKNREPDCIYPFGTKYWCDDQDKYHNDNGYPAVIYSDGTKFWFKHGLRHNDFGPAIIYSWGGKQWFIDDNFLTEEEFKQHKIKQFINE